MSEVEVGSEAHLQGLRTGDQILKVLLYMGMQGTLMADYRQRISQMKVDFRRKVSMPSSKKGIEGGQ